VDQMVLLKMTKPVASGLFSGGEMIQLEKVMTVYPERLRSYIHSLHKYCLPQLHYL
jgi:hypothetical protein